MKINCLNVDLHPCRIYIASSFLQVSPSDPEDIRLSVLTPPLSAEASYSNGLPDCTLQDIRRKYSNFAEVIEPPREGFLLTLKLNFARLPRVKGMIIFTSLMDQNQLACSDTARNGEFSNEKRKNISYCIQIFGLVLTAQYLSKFC